MTRFNTSLRIARFAVVFCVPVTAMACSSDDGHGPTIGAPTTMVPIGEGGNAPSGGGSPGSGGTDTTGSAGTINGAGGTPTFGAGGGTPSGVAGTTTFGAGGGTDPFGVGGNPSGDPFTGGTAAF
jgi:hypothetical protein